jgi:hypothetical protein
MTRFELCPLTSVESRFKEDNLPLFKFLIEIHTFPDRKMLFLIPVGEIDLSIDWEVIKRRYDIINLEVRMLRNELPRCSYTSPVEYGPIHSYEIEVEFNNTNKTIDV